MAASDLVLKTNAPELYESRCLSRQHGNHAALNNGN